MAEIPLSGEDSVKITDFLRDLTYAEVHAFAIGATQGAGAVVAYAIGLPSLAVGLVATAFVLLGWVQTCRTEDVPFVTSIVSSIPAGLRGQIRKERHYYGGGFLLATAATLAAWILLF